MPLQYFTTQLINLRQDTYLVQLRDGTVPFSGLKHTNEQTVTQLTSEKHWAYELFGMLYTLIPINLFSGGM